MPDDKGHSSHTSRSHIHSEVWNESQIPETRLAKDDRHDQPVEVASDLVDIDSLPMDVDEAMEIELL